MDQQHSDTSTKDILKKAFLWMIVFDYLLLAFFLLQLSNLTLNSGTLISLLMWMLTVCRWHGLVSCQKMAK